MRGKAVGTDLPWLGITIPANDQNKPIIIWGIIIPANDHNEPIIIKNK